MKTLTKRDRRTRGFSLVEVTLAIGITAVALVSLMGMLPKGLQTLRKANDQAVMGRIHQQILGELQLTPWESAGGGTSPIESFDGSIRYYDDQGIELPGGEKGGFAHVYTARISVPRSGQSLPASVGANSYNGIEMPGEKSVSVGDAQDYMRLVIVEVTSVADPGFLENPETGFDNLPKSNVETYRTFVVKMGRDYEP